MIDQKIAGNGGDPGHKRTLARVIGIQGAVHLDKDLLGEVLSILGIPGKSVADVINSPMIPLNNLLPGRGIAGNAATDQQSDNLGVIQTELREPCARPPTVAYPSRPTDWQRCIPKTITLMSSVQRS